MYIVSHLLNLISVYHRWSVFIFGPHIFQVWTAPFAPWTLHFGWTARLE
jgi:hypothetical protein